MTAPSLNAARPVTHDVALLVEIVTGLAAAEALWRGHVTHDAAERARRRLLATPAYEVWLLGWTPGQSVGLHDHGDANGAFVVVEGELVETRLTVERVASARLTVGGIGTIPAGVVHDVANRSAQVATSIHVYSQPLMEMGFYGADGSLVRTEAVHEQSALISPAELRRALHPSRSPRR